MNYKRLEKNLCDNIAEAQIKLGYDDNPMSFNYMSSSLNHLLGTELNDDELENTLSQFAEYVEKHLGELNFRPIKNGFCITVPSKGTRYIHNNIIENSFIYEFVNTVRSHTTINNVLDVFRKYSSDVIIKEIDNDEFNFLVYFPAGIPDEYRYCLTVEEEIDGSSHIIYHRFIKEDYEDFGFSE